MIKFKHLFKIRKNSEIMLSTLFKFVVSWEARQYNSSTIEKVANLF